MLSEAQARSLELGLGHGLTNSAVDNARAVACIHAAEAWGEREVGVRLALNARANHRRWITEVQRRWQRETRRPSRARHHDSIEIRERYVRCV